MAPREAEKKKVKIKTAKAERVKKSRMNLFNNEFLICAHFRKYFMSMGSIVILHILNHVINKNEKKT